MRTEPVLDRTLSQGDTAPAATLLLDCFARFYEEVARIKSAANRGTLSDELAEDGIKPLLPADMARAASTRLQELLHTQGRAMQQRCTQAELRLYAIARYVMVVVADETFILNLDWPAQTPWLEMLLEYRLFQSRLAGRRFFELADQLLKGSAQSDLHRDLAACFLMALQLGFKGMHRGPQGEAALDALRQRLHSFVQAGNLTAAPHLFAQAYDHTQTTHLDVRVAPLRRWSVWAGWFAVGFVLLSSAIWLWMTRVLVSAGVA
jgi:type VI secretion system protein ImpK